MSRGWGHAISKAVQHRSCHAPVGNTEAIRHVLLLFHFSTNCAYRQGVQNSTKVCFSQLGYDSGSEHSRPISVLLLWLGETRKSTVLGETY